MRAKPAVEALALGVLVTVCAAGAPEPRPLTKTVDYNAAPLLAGSSSGEYSLDGLSTNGWQDRGTPFQCASNIYPAGIGLLGGGSVGASSATWWLDGAYSTFDAVVFMDDRVVYPYGKLSVYGDDVLLVATPGLVGQQSAALSNVDVRGVQYLRLEVDRFDTWGGRDTQYLFLTRAQVRAVAEVPAYYHDALGAGTSSAHPEFGVAVIYSNCVNQISNAPSIDAWNDTGARLMLNGTNVNGIGLTGPDGQDPGSITWRLSPTGLKAYRVLTFDLAADDRWNPIVSDASVRVLTNGVLAQEIPSDMTFWGKTPPRPSLTFTINIEGADTLELVTQGHGWGPDKSPYWDIINPRLIARMPRLAAALTVR